jgi:serine/threonine protein kinase
MSVSQTEDAAFDPCTGYYMNRGELVLLNQQLVKAKMPEEVFGVVNNPVELHENFLAMVKICHADRWSVADKPLAEETFKKLQEWKCKALERMNAGLYGSKKPDKPKEQPILVKSKLHTYTIKELVGKTGTSNLYKCLYDGKIGLFKVVRSPKENEFATNEAKVLKRLWDKDIINVSNRTKYVLEMVDNFVIMDEKKVRRTAIVFPYSEDCYTLKEIREQFKDGVDPRDAAWMFNRMLEGLFFVHKTKVIHGNITPMSVVLNVRTHAGFLTDWSYSIIKEDEGSRLTAISQDYMKWYPPEVLKKEPTKPSVDIFMAAKCMIYLLGGDAVDETLPSGVPKQIGAFLRSCLLKNKDMRSDDAGGYRYDFGELLGRLYGKRTFRVLDMPKTRS